MPAGAPFRVPRRHGAVPGTQPYTPSTVNIGNTVSTTGSTSITGSVTVSGITNTVSVQGTVTANPTTSAAFVTNQVTITSGGAATILFAANASVLFREVTNPTASNAIVALGAVGVTLTTGHFLPGATAFDQQYNTAALYGVAVTGSVTVSTIGW